MHKYIWIVICLLCLNCFSIEAKAAPSAEEKAVVTTVTADGGMVYDSAAKKVTFSKNVKVVHLDFTMTSDKLFLFLNGDSATKENSGLSAMGGGKVERIVAEKNVKITLPEGRKATCEKAVYTVVTETLVMEGSPVLSEDNNLISGKRVIFYFKENRSEIQGGARVDFTTKDENGTSVKDKLTKP